MTHVAVAVADELHMIFAENAECKVGLFKDGLSLLHIEH